MNEIQIFENNEFGKVRMVLVNGKPHAVGVDIARALEYAKPSQAVIDHCKGIRKLGIPSKGGMQETNVIPQGDIVRLVVKAAEQSRNEVIKAKAEKFESWIFDDVIPTILETGQYSIKSDPSKEMRAEAMLNNSQTRKAKLFYEIAKGTTNELYRQAGEALAMNLLAGKEVVSLPVAEQRANHELGYFCQFIGKAATWATVLGKKLKAEGIEKNAETGVYKVTWDKGNNQRDSFYWFDDVLLPILERMFPAEYVAER